jgi:hypothetical protein
MKKFVNSTKRFIVKHKVGIAVTCTVIVMGKLNKLALREHESFMQEHGILDMYYNHGGEIWLRLEALTRLLVFRHIHIAGNTSHIMRTLYERKVMENTNTTTELIILRDRRGSAALVLMTTTLLYLAYTIGKVKGEFATRPTSVKWSKD